MLKIKLYPKGKKHQITYRVVVSEARSKANGKFTDDLGFYIPQTKELKIDQQKLAQWQKNGAQITLGVDKLLNPDKYPRIKKKKSQTETETKKPETKPVESEKTIEAPEETSTEAPAETPAPQTN